MQPAEARSAYRNRPLYPGGLSIRPSLLGGLLGGLLSSLVAAYPVAAQGVFVRGDCDQSLALNITDAVRFLDYLFLGGGEPPCLDACDVDNSESLQITDAIYLLGYLFLGGPEPHAPYPIEGVDDEDALLSCENGRDPPLELRVAPEALLFTRAGQGQVLTVAARLTEGAPLEDVRLSASTHYLSLRPSVAEVTPQGVVTARAIGETRLEVRHRGRLREVSVRVLPGADGSPVVHITSPADGSVVTSDRVSLSGFVTDPAAALGFRGGAGGEERSLENRDGSFSAAIEATLGGNVLEVIARGVAGEGRALVSITRVLPGAPEAVGLDGKPLPALVLPLISPPDVSPPSIRIDSPVHGAILLRGSVRVRGTVDDPLAAVSLNGLIASRSGDRFEAELTLPPGPSALRAEAVDPVGNRSAAVIAVRVDASVPRVSITSPLDASTIVVGGGAVSVRGNVDPPGTPVRVNGSLARVSGSTWSAELSFPPGMHDLVATASLPGSLPRAAQVSRTIAIDVEAPHAVLAWPPEAKLLGTGHRVETGTVTFAGRIEDLGVPRDSVGPLTVTIGAAVSSVPGGSFAVTVPLAPGVNVLQLTAADARGNASVRTHRVLRGGPAAPLLAVVSGDGQSVTAGETAALPLTVAALDAAGRPQRGVALAFSVAQGDGTLDGETRARTVVTGADGRASSLLRAGSQAGAGSHVVTVKGPLHANSPIAFVLHVLPTSARVLVAHRRRSFTGTAGEQLPAPLEARLLDDLGSSIDGALVTFRVLEGGARIAGGLEGSILTNGPGVAGVRVTLPPAGDSISVVEASAAGAEPVRFHVEGLQAGPVADTAVSGAVLDERGQPIAGALVRAFLASGSLDATTDASGGFRIAGIPAGDILLAAAGPPPHADASTRILAVAGRDNRLEDPLRLTRLDTGSAGAGRVRTELITPSRGALIALSALPGVRLAVASGSATFPDGSRSGAITLAALNLSALPSTLPDDLHLHAPVAVFPEGVRFDPPASLTLPAAGWQPGRTVPLFVHRGSSGGFLELPGGVVGEEGTLIALEGASGLRTGGALFAALPGPREGRTGALYGRTDIVLLGASEAPQRPESAVLGFNTYAHSGEMFVEAVDLELPSPGRGPSYRFRRRYESRHRFRGSLGHNWEHEYEDRRLHPGLGAGNVVRADGAGRFDEYLLDSSSGTFIAPPGVWSRLFAEQDGFLIERDAEGTRHRYHPLDDSPSSGRLESVSDRHGNAIRFARDSRGLIAEASDALGRTVRYTHDVEGRITSVEDFTGRTVAFSYSAEGDLVSVRGPIVLGTATDNNFPEGKRTEYVYTSGRKDERLNHNLEKIIDPRQAVSEKIPRITVTYGEDPGLISFDRVITQLRGGVNSTGVPAGGTVSFEYESWRAPSAPSPRPEDLEGHLLSAAGITRFRDEENRLRDVVWSGAGLPLRERVHTLEDGRPRDASSLHPPPGTIPPFYETRWTWTRDGLLRSRVEPRGDRVDFVHDEGCPLRQGRAFVIREERHPAPGTEDATPATTDRKRDPLFGVVVEETSPLGAVTRRFLDYQEGSALEDLAAAAGVAPGDLAGALSRSGIVLGLGDLNGNGSVLQRSGNVVREMPPPVTLPDGTSGEGFLTFTFNRFGQITSRTSAAGRVTRFEYHPETDFDGNGAPNPEDGRDPDTGGFLARRIAVLRSGEGTAGELVLERNVYDPRGFLASRTDGSGAVEFHSWNALGQLVELRLPPPLKYRWHFLRDADDNLVRERVENYTSIDGGGHFLVSGNRWIDTDYEHDLLGRTVTVIREVSEGEVGPAASLTTRHRYHPAGGLARVIHPVEGTDEAWSRDERGLVREHTRGAGSPGAPVSKSFHDENGNLVLSTSAEGRTEERRHDGFGRLAAVIDAAGGARILERDLEGRIISESFLGSPGGPTPGDGAGNVLLSRVCHRRDERGRVFETTRFRFDLGSGTAPPAATETLVERWFHDPDGLVTRRIDPEGGEWSYTYDGAGRLLRVLDPAGGTRSFTRDGNGDPIKEVLEELTLEPVHPGAAGDPDYADDGRFRQVTTIVRAFDPLRRLTLLVDTRGGVWRARYDSRSNLILVSDAEGSSIRGDPDPEVARVLHLVTQRQREGLNDHGNRVRFVHDNLGRLVEARHELRRDGFGGGPIDVLNPFNRDGIITEKLEWDGNGRLAAWTDDTGQRTEVHRDAAGFVRQKTWPDRTFETHVRDRDGSLVERVEPNGTRVVQEFDVLRRVARRSITRAEGVEGTTLQRFEYDGLSRVTLAYDDNGPGDPSDDSLVLFRRDSFGDIVEETRDGFSFATRRDRAGRPVLFRYPDGRQVELSRDRAGRMAALSSAAGRHASYRHFGSGTLLEKRFSSGITLSFLAGDTGSIPRDMGHDAHGEVLQLNYRDAGGNTIHGFEYGRDRSGEKLYEKPFHRLDNLGEVWRYDSVGRIQRFLPNVFEPRVPPIDPLEKIVFYPDGNHSWRFLEVDFSIHRLSVNARGAYVSADSETFVYDAVGSLRSTGDLSYTHDALRRLVRVARGGQLVATYRYDAAGAEDPESYLGAGRMAWKDVKIPVRNQPAGVVRFVHDGDRIVQESDAAGQTIRQYLYEDGGRPAVLLDFPPTASPEAHDFLLDAAGSVTAVLDRFGRVEETVRYGLHGEARIVNRFGNPDQFSTIGNTLGFGGLHHDFEIGLLLVGGRHFDPALGRFLTDQSPLFPPGLLHLNGYLLPGLPGLAGTVTGLGSASRKATCLEPLRKKNPFTGPGEERVELGSPGK
ncbi:MAG TPA: carboxypeptidase regulatory-like domain-containing protein [Planctomycetota bacterium]|nr:carboxypeptidase regulatory-like domain-containing protein [Planctomycetota bacterium]